MSKRELILLLLCLLSLIPIFATVIPQRIVDFGYTSVTLTRLYISSGRIETNPFTDSSQFYAGSANDMSTRPFPSLFIAIFSSITGIDPETVLYLPILGLLSIVFIAMWMKLLSSSTVLTILFGLTIAFSFQFRSFNTVYYIPYGLSMFSIFAYFLVRSYVRGDISGSSPYSPRARAHAHARSLVYVILFIASLGAYYSSTFLILVLVFSLILLDSIKSKRRSQYFSVYLALILLILMVTFEQKTYTFVSMSSLSTAISGTAQYFQYIIGIFTQQGAFQQQRPQFGGNSAILYSDLVNRISLGATISLYALLWIAQKIRTSSNKTHPLLKDNRLSAPHWPFCVSLVMVGVIETILYSFVGQFATTRVLYIAISLLALYLTLVMYRSRRSIWIRYFAVALLVLAITSNVWHFTAYTIDPSSQINGVEKADPSIQWFVAFAGPNSSIYSFHAPAAPLFETVVASNKSDNIRVFAIFPESHLAIGSFALLTSEKVVTFGYAPPVPLSEMQRILSTETMDLIFSDGYGEVYKKVLTEVSP